MKNSKRKWWHNLKNSKRKWWHNLYFEFYINIYLLRVQTRLLQYSIERLTYDVCRIRFDILKWKVFEFDLYKRER